MRTILDNWGLEVYFVLLMSFVGINAIVYRNILDIIFFGIISLIIVYYFVSSKSER